FARRGLDGYDVFARHGLDGVTELVRDDLGRREVDDLVDRGQDPRRHSFLMTSTGLTPSFSARSLTDSVGGRTARRSPLVSILVATAGLKAERAASIAPGARGAAALRVSLLCWRKLTSSFWLMPSSRASSCAFIPDY